jgi:hypothetical protein
MLGGLATPHPTPQNCSDTQKGQPSLFHPFHPSTQFDSSLPTSMPRTPAPTTIRGWHIFLSVIVQRHHPPQALWRGAILFWVLLLIHSHFCLDVHDVPIFRYPVGDVKTYFPIFSTGTIILRLTGEQAVCHSAPGVKRLPTVPAWGVPHYPPCRPL